MPRPSLLPWLLALGLALPGVARAADDWSSSLYTEGGVELRVDERIFTLFAALNALGFEEAPVGRKDPFPRREFDPVRQKVRDAVRLDPKLRAKWDAFLDAHPVPLRSYVAFTLALSGAPGFAIERSPPREAQSLKGLETLLAELHAQAKLGALFSAVASEQREAMKRWSPLVDAPLAKTRELLGEKETEDSPRVILVVNLLDGRGASSGVSLGEEIFLVVGPAGGSDVMPAAKAFARVLVQGAVDRRFSGLKGGAELWSEVKESGHNVGVDGLSDYLAENLARATAVRAAVTEKDAARALDGEYRSGFVLVKDMNRGLSLLPKSGKNLETFLGDFLREVDAGRATAALKGN